MTENHLLNEGNIRNGIKENTKPSTTSEQKPIKQPPSPKDDENKLEITSCCKCYNYVQFFKGKEGYCHKYETWKKKELVV